MVPVAQFKDMTRVESDRIVIFVPNLCGGETRITVFKSSCPDGNIENLKRLRR